MNIILKKIPGMLVDAWFCLYFIFNDNYADMLARYNLIIEPEIERALKYYKENLNIQYEFMGLFFKECSTTEEVKAILPPFTNSSFLFQFNDLNTYFNYLESANEASIRRDFIRTLLRIKDKDANEIDFLLTNEHKLIEKIDEENLSPDLKWRALSFIKRPMKAMEDYIKLLKEFFILYESSTIKKCLKKHDAFYNQLEQLNTKEKYEFIHEFVDNYWNENMISETTYLSPLFFNSISMLAGDDEDSTTYMFIGYKFNDTVKQLGGSCEIEKKLNILKNMSDPTRFKILMLLKAEELYGQQIADKVGLTMATVSYHMNFLVAGNMVDNFERGHRVYYKLHEDTFREISEFIKNQFLK